MHVCPQVSLALGLESSGWAGLAPGDLVAAAAASGEHGSALLTSAGFAAGLAGLARRCGVCLASFPSSWLLERHALLQHAGLPGDDKPFTCEQCGQRYRYRSAYVKHREQNHRARLPADKLFTCEVCGMQFRYLKSFKKHRLNHALERLQRAPSSESQALTERSDQVSSTGEPSQLETGSAGDASPLQLDSEVEREGRGGRDTPSEPREEAGSSETASLHEHATESGDGLEPGPRTALAASPSSEPEDEERPEDASPAGLTTTGAVAAATTTISGSSSSPVPGSISTSLNLTLGGSRGGGPGGNGPAAARAGSHHHHHHHHHHDVDRRERRFACPFCGKCVRSKENLKLHVRKHTGERPFVCLFCGRAFGGKSDLTRHLRIHTGERPYHCEMCGKCFARADYLSKHLTTHIHQR